MGRMQGWVGLGLLAMATVAGAQQRETAAGTSKGTVEAIKAAGRLRCGLVREEPEYSNLDAHGNRALFDVDLCKAVAVAVLGAGARFEMVPYADENDALAGLRAGAVEMVATASKTLTNSGVEGPGRGFVFGPVMLWDPQTVMVNNGMGVHSLADLAGKKVCYLTETDFELNLNEGMARRGIKFLQFPFQEEGEMEAAYLTNNCAGISADATQLAYERIAFRAKGRDYEILPDVLAQDPLATATRGDDRAWSEMVWWVENALVLAEEDGVTQLNVSAMKSGATTEPLRRFLGARPGIGKALGLDDAWVERVVRAVGNYGEIYARDLGPTTPMRLERGENRLAADGGLMTAMPMR